MIISFGIFALFLAGCAKQEVVVAENSFVEKETAEQRFAEQPKALLSDSKNGVEVVINSVKRESGKTVISVTIDNHYLDVSGDEPKKLSSLNGSRPADYIVQNAQSGGHHAEGVMVFDGDLAGEFIFGLKEDLTFKFNIE